MYNESIHQKEKLTGVYDAVNNVYFCEATDSIQYHPPNANLECDSQSVYFHCMYVFMYVCVCVCVRACVRAFVRACVCVYVCMYETQGGTWGVLGGQNAKLRKIYQAAVPIGTKFVTRLRIHLGMDIG